MRREINAANMQAYLTAGLIRAARLPDPRTLQVGAGPSREQSPEEQWAIFQAMAAAQSRTQH